MRFLIIVPVLFVAGGSEVVTLQNSPLNVLKAYLDKKISEGDKE
jgi:hypothetical protein